MLIEAEGILYRGAILEDPDEVWNYPGKRWVTYHGGAGSLAEPQEIDEARAEALKVDNPSAEYFMYYDSPPWAQPYSPAIEWSDEIKEAMARREAELADMKDRGASG